MPQCSHHDIFQLSTLQPDAIFAFSHYRSSLSPLSSSLRNKFSAATGFTLTVRFAQFHSVAQRNAQRIRSVSWQGFPFVRSPLNAKNAFSYAPAASLPHPPCRLPSLLTTSLFASATHSTQLFPSPSAHKVIRSKFIAPFFLSRLPLTLPFVHAQTAQRPGFRARSKIRSAAWKKLQDIHENTKDNKESLSKRFTPPPPSNNLRKSSLRQQVAAKLPRCACAALSGRKLPGLLATSIGFRVLLLWVGSVVWRG